MRRPVFLKAILLLLLLPLIGAAQDGGDVIITPVPHRPFVERRDGQQVVNFNLLVQNRGSVAFTLVALKLTVFDGAGALVLAREMSENGHPPAIDVVGSRILPTGGVIDIFQPFYSFAADVPLMRMHYELLFMRQGSQSPPIAITADRTLSIDVYPRPAEAAALRLPLRGRVLVHDGHDYFSHHRRFNLAARFAADPATALPANLYAYDFVLIGAKGELFDGDPATPDHWKTYSAPVYAPTAGVVTEVADGIPENTFEGTAARQPADAERTDPQGFGNHIVVMDREGRHSWLLHLKPGSLAVKTGDRVRAGQRLGAVGFSGDSLFPHLHFMVTASGQYPSQGVPVDFLDFTRVLGARRMHVAQGQIDTGDIVESR